MTNGPGGRSSSGAAREARLELEAQPQPKDARVQDLVEPVERTRARGLVVGSGARETVSAQLRRGVEDVEEIGAQDEVRGAEFHVLGQAEVQVVDGRQPQRVQL